MNLWEFYAEVEKLIVELRASNQSEAADEVETAIRGGSTSGEILGRLCVALDSVPARVPSVTERAGQLAKWADEIVRKS